MQITRNTDLSSMAKDLSKIVAEAWLDPTFKGQLLQNPNEVILEKLGWRAEGVSFKVDESASTWKMEPISTSSEEVIVTIPLPPRPTTANNPSDEELRGWLEGSSTQYPCCLPNC